jgi:solute carrier family 8 (sodium/calcium exchanger)
MLKKVPAGNILLSAAILFSGSLPGKVLRLLKIYGCAAISRNTYFLHQESFLQPSILTIWNEHQTELFKQLRREKRSLVLGGDGRADSPGHSAKYGSYTTMELKKKVVLDIELVQVCKHVHTLWFHQHFKIHRVTKLRVVTTWRWRDSLGQSNS